MLTDVCQLSLILALIHASSIIPAGESVTVKAHDSATIPCSATVPKDDTVISVTWYRDTQFFLSYNPLNRQIKFITPDTKENSRFNITSQSDLHISDTNVRDSTNYFCKRFIQNKQGNITTEESTTLLVVQDKPHKPKPPVIIGNSSRSLSVRWSNDTSDNNSPIINYIIKAKKLEQNWTEANEVRLGGQTYETRITGLRPYTKYLIQLIAENSVGASVPSEVTGPVYTAEEIPSSPPNITSYEHTNTTITVSWEPPPSNTLNGILDSYELSYERLTFRPLKKVITDPLQKTITIYGLHCDSKYTVELSACTVQCGPVDRFVVTTDEGIPTKPRIYRISGQTSNSFTVHWEKPTMSNGKIIMYELVWSTGDEPQYSRKVSADTLLTITQLRPYTSYKLKVAAYTHAGRSEFSETVPALTDVGKPKKPDISNATAISNSSIFVKWEYKNPSRIEHFYGFRIVYRVEGGERYLYKDIRKDAREVLLEKLELNRRYEIYMQSIVKSLFSSNLYESQQSNVVSVNLRNGGPFSH